MGDIESDLSHVVEQALASLAPSVRTDVYAVSFFIYDDGDDPRRPTLTVGVNTNRRWQDSIPDAYDSAEAKWNFAFWMQEDLAMFGASGHTTGALVHAWIVSRGNWFTDDEDNDESRAEHFDECADAITNDFVELACRGAAELHRKGLVTRLFGRTIPIIVHELEYDEEIADQTKRANPPGVADEFAEWVMSM